MNVGATTETDYGYYFQWGDIVDKSNAYCSWSSYKHCNGSSTTLTKYNNSTSYGENPDGKTTLEPEDDAATQIMEGDWRMPTKDDFQELIDETTNEWTKVNGVNGYKFTGSNGNSIFIPAAGYRNSSSFDSRGFSCYIWSSSPDATDPRTALMLFFSSTYIYTTNFTRSFGLPVRGVL